MKVRLGTRIYDSEKSKEICNTPHGVLFRKRSGEFWLYNKSKAEVKPMSWVEANDLIKQYGTREQYLDIFTLYGGRKGGNPGHIFIDGKHMLRARRNADKHRMSVTTYINYLIDRDDNSHNYCK